MTNNLIKPSYGVAVVRCQVHQLHDGHMELFRAIHARHNRVLIFVGVAPTGMTRLNPLDFETRKRMIQAKFRDFIVLPLVDQKDDNYWSKMLDQKIEEVAQYGDVTLYGGRDSFFPHYHGKYQPIDLVMPYLANHSGTAIRDSLTNAVMESADFRAGVIYAAQNLRPRAVPCVDIAILHVGVETAEAEVLLARKPGEERWRFVGGHADPTSRTYEDDARREVSEETGLHLELCDYIGSALIDDWRWKGTPDKVKTLLFVGVVTFQNAVAQDDIQDVRWFRLAEVSEHTIEPVHHSLLNLFQKYLKKEGLYGKPAPESVAANGLL